MLTIKKWLTCFVEWKQDDGTYALSAIPWHILLMGILAKITHDPDILDFEWGWVPPWRVRFID